MSDAPEFDIKWLDAGREPQCAPNPAYPDGIDVDLTNGKPGCIIAVPYPARRCGGYVVECKKCGTKVGLTTAGRPDDPRTVRIPCKERSFIPAVREERVKPGIVVGQDQTTFDGGSRKPVYH